MSSADSGQWGIKRNWRNVCYRHYCDIFDHLSLYEIYEYCCVQGVPQTTHLLTHEQLVALSGMVECELPNRHVYAFVGNICFKDQL